MIDWQRLSPDASAASFKEGVEYMLAVPNRLGAAYGGDGRKLNPIHPYLVYVGRWIKCEGRWEADEASDWGSTYLDRSEPSHFACITLPTA